MTGLEIFVRSALRRTGLLGVISGLPRTLRSRRYRSQYLRQRPKQVAVELPPWQAAMLVSSEHEYTIIRSKREDYRLMQRLSDHLRPGGVFWDVGSNIGFYTVLAAKMVGQAGRVIAFEPEPHSRARLGENIRLNGLVNVDILPVALGARPGRLRLSAAAEASDGSHRLVEEGNIVPHSELVEVEVTTGDGLRKERGLGVPQGVKIDVEGFELDVLRGMHETLRQPECRAVLCEVHFSILESKGQRNAPLEVQALLRECGLDRLDWVDRSHLLASRR